MTYIYAWGPRIRRWPATSPLKQLDRKGEPCEVLARGAMNSALVRFPSDGKICIISRSALRKPKTAGALAISRLGTYSAPTGGRSSRSPAS